MLQELYKSLERPHASKYGGIVQNIILLNVLVNIFVSFSNYVFNFSQNVQSIFLAIEYVTVFIFIAELVIRYMSIGYDKRYKGFKGKISYTVTPFIIIDILTLIPYLFINVDTGILLARLIRFLRFIRVLRLLRLKDTIKRFFSLSYFASSSIFYQFIVLFLLSTFFITIFSFVYSSGDKTSLMIFLDPPALAETATSFEMAFGVIELLIGLFIGGALISIITELLANISNDIKNGYYPYKGENHIVIINQNSKLEFILTEINYYYSDLEQLQDVILFLPFVDDIEEFNQNMKNYSNLNISLIKGDILNWNSYEKLNINFAKKVLLLQEKNTDIKHLNMKISKYLLYHDNFKNENLEFVIEAQNNRTLQIVYEEIFAQKSNQYTIVNHNVIIEKFLSRSIVEPDYFKVYETLLSFQDHEFYTIEYKEVFQLSNLSFEDAYMQFSKGILVGIIREDSLMLNPKNSLLLNSNDTLVCIIEDKNTYSIEETKTISKDSIKIDTPKVKSSRKICIIGDYDDIYQEQIAEFLTHDSLKNLKKIILEDNNYIKDNFWDELVEENYDMIILNMEDDDEFILTMYLRNRYKNNTKFLNSLVNIIHNPINAKLLTDTSLKHNIILSEKLVSEYITQIIFNHNVVGIFQELTQSNGNEFYILRKDKYPELFSMDQKELKLSLLANNMLFIGLFKDERFMVNDEQVNNADSIVIIAQGDV